MLVGVEGGCERERESSPIVCPWFEGALGARLAVPSWFRIIGSEIILLWKYSNFSQSSSE